MVGPFFDMVAMVDLAEEPTNRYESSANSAMQLSWLAMGLALVHDVVVQEVEQGCA